MSAQQNVAPEQDTTAVAPVADRIAPSVVRHPRILQLVHSDEGGGVEALARLIADGLTARGASVRTHFVYGKGGHGRLAKLRAVAATAALLARERPDAVIAFQTTASLLSGATGLVTGCRLRIVHQTALPTQIHPLLRGLDRLAGTMGLYTINVANSQATAAAFADYPLGYRRALHLIEHGLTPPRPRTSRAQTLAQWGIPDDLPIVFNAGRLSDQKAQDIVIAAMAQVPKARLVIAGGGPNETAYRTLATEAGAAERVHFLGLVQREEVENLYGAADLFVFPSVWETFGLAGVEAAMSGLPVIASDIAVLREVLAAPGAEAATFVASRAPADWAAAIRASLADPDASARAGQAAGLIRDRYAESRMIDAYAALLRGIRGATVGHG